MATPIQINFEDTQDVATDLGPKSLGGALYVVGEDPTSKINVFKSLDGGATWAPMDGGNAPSKVSIAHTTEIGIDVVWHGTSVTVAYNKAGTIFFYLKTFNTATDTWGTESAQGPNENDSNTRDQTLRVFRTAGGNFFLFYTEWLTTFQTINYSVYNGVSWGANTILVNCTGTEFNYISNACVDQSGNFHIFYRKCTVQGITGTPYHISLSSLGVAGTAQQISNTPTDVAFGRSCALADSLILPAYDTNDKAGVWVGTPISAPVWSFALVDTLSLGVGVHDIGDLSAVSAGPRYGGRAFSFVDGTTAYLVWESTNGPTPNKLSGGYTINRIYSAASSSTGTSWGTPTLVHDEALEPGAWYGTNDPDISGITASIIGGLLTTVANLNCEGVAFLANGGGITPPTPPVGNPLTIICNDPPNGQVGVPY